MNKIITFIPKKELTARQNLANFIQLSKHHLNTWNDIVDFHWDSMRWVTQHGTIRFISQEHSSLHPSVAPTPAQLMHPDFIEMAKAYLRYKHTLKPHKNIRREIQALRALELVLKSDLGTPDITKVTQVHFDRAVHELARLKGAPLIAGALQNIMRELADIYIITDSANYWSHPYVGVRSYRNTQGSHAPQEVKDQKVINQDALLAIGDVFSRGYTQTLDDVDVMVTSVTALLLSAPMRIAETIRFRIDCLASDEDKNGKKQYYLKYWVPKTREYARKPIPEVMAETAIEAIRRLTIMTEEGRRLARHMETNPTKFYRHSNCPPVDDNTVLTRDQVAQALGYCDRKSVECYIKKHTGNMRLTGFTLDSLWQLVLKDHNEANPHFPYQEPVAIGSARPPKMSESLLCIRRLQFGIGKNTSPVLLASFNKDYYLKRLDATVKEDRRNTRPMCFFTRHGFEAIKVKSHGIRHLLNRLARQSGVSIDVITAWSSRSSAQQTLTYLDNDQGQIATEFAHATGMSVEQSPKPSITQEEAAIYDAGPIHRSRYGLCVRSWRIGPCNKFADCLNCSELLMCKGDRVAAELIAQDRMHIANTYESARKSNEGGERSATRWMKLARNQIEKLDQLLSIFNDPNIEDSTPIAVAGSDFNHETELIKVKANEAGVQLMDRNKLSIEYGSDLLACLDELRG